MMDGLGGTADRASIVLSLAMVVLAGTPNLRAQTDAPTVPRPSAPSPDAALSGETPSSEAIDHWIRQLDADQFLQREEATEKLIAAGNPAIGRLLKSIQSSRSAESQIRAVFVLKQLALSEEEQPREAAREALEQIAALALGTASQKASQTLEVLTVLRQRRALDELIKLGAKTVPERTHQIEFVYGLEFDDQWKGADEDLRRLKWLPNIRQITLTGPKVTDAWLEAVGTLGDLNTLSVNRASVTSDGMRHVASLKNLKLLEMKYVPVDDSAVPHLARLTGIDTMKLYGTQITPQGAAQLRQALPIARIDHRAGAFLGISGDHHSLGCLIHTVRPNTSAAAAGLIPGDVIVLYDGKRVGDFEALTELISKNRPGDEVTLQFVRNTDSLTVTRTRLEGEVHGIRGKDHPLGCQIEAVAPNSTASRLGLEPGDIIHRVRGELVENVKSFEQLYDQIKVGETIALEFTRDAQLRTVRVVLGEWD